MLVVKTLAEVGRPEIAGGVFVPTMGALHAGHAALVREAARIKQSERIAGPLVVSVFVNPTQFNDRSDLARYPRTLAADVALCAAAGAEVIFAPAVETVYPPGETISTPPLPDVATKPGLEDALRPGHFAGVCQVVARLFALVRPAVAVFGEKDWQQLQVVRGMVGSGLPRIVGLPTVREADGLAMSSRNVFLSASDRAAGLAISRGLGEAAKSGTVAEAEAGMRAELESAGMKIEYAVVRDAETLMPVAGRARACRALIAARVGSVRLIDNAAWSAARSG